VCAGKEESQLDVTIMVYW